MTVAVKNGREWKIIDIPKCEAIKNEWKLWWCICVLCPLQLKLLDYKHNHHKDNKMKLNSKYLRFTWDTLLLPLDNTVVFMNLSRS